MSTHCSVVRCVVSKESVPVSTLALFASVEPFVRSELDEAVSRKLSHKIVFNIQ